MSLGFDRPVCVCGILTSTQSSLRRLIKKKKSAEVAEPHAAFTRTEIAQPQQQGGGEVRRRGREDQLETLQSAQQIVWGMTNGKLVLIRPRATRAAIRPSCCTDLAPDLPATPFKQWLVGKGSSDLRPALAKPTCSQCCWCSALPSNCSLKQPLVVCPSVLLNTRIKTSEQAVDTPMAVPWGLWRPFDFWWCVNILLHRGLVVCLAVGIVLSGVPHCGRLQYFDVNITVILSLIALALWTRPYVSHLSLSVLSFPW